MEDVIKIMKSNIKKDTLLVEQAELLKKEANVSSFKALTFLFLILIFIYSLE